MNKKTPNIVTLAILTTITVISWVGLEIYRNYMKEPPTVVPKEIIAPLDPTLNTEALSSVKDRVEVDINQPELPPETAQPTPLETVQPTEPTASASASVEPTL